MNYTIPIVQDLIAQGKIISKTGSSHCVVEVDGNDSTRPQTLIIKFGRQVWKTEALAMKLVAERTSVPVPKLYAYLSERQGPESRKGYIIMEKVPGTVLADSIDALDGDTVAYVANQLKEYVDELHKLDGQGWGLPGKDGMYHRTYFNYAPGPARLSSTKEFINYYAIQGGAPLPTDHGNLLQGIDLDRPPIFSHGDLLPENIMIDRASGFITSIIDWECAGGYPYFWNAYAASRRVANSSSPSRNWEAIYTTSMGRYSKEIKAFEGFPLYASLYGSYDFNLE